MTFVIDLKYGHTYINMWILMYSRIMNNLYVHVSIHIIMNDHVIWLHCFVLVLNIFTEMSDNSCALVPFIDMSGYNWFWENYNKCFQWQIHHQLALLKAKNKSLEIKLHFLQEHLHYLVERNNNIMQPGITYNNLVSTSSWHLITRRILLCVLLIPVTIFIM